MWISKELSKGEQTPSSQTATSTLNSNGTLEVVGSGVSRGVEMFAPYGYAYSLPAGESVLLNRSDGTQMGVGVSMRADYLDSGEIKITAGSGAYIHLTANGDVIINGLRINRNGVIE